MRACTAFLHIKYFVHTKIFKCSNIYNREINTQRFIHPEFLNLVHFKSVNGTVTEDQLHAKGQPN